MAVESKGNDASAMSSGRRFVIGANVTIAIVVAALLLVAVNWICSLKYVREDMASFSHYGLSDRTKRVLDGYSDEIQIAVLYASDEEDEEQQERVSRLTDYCDELEAYASGVQVRYVTKASQREKLVARISQTFGGEAETHKGVLESFDRLRSELDAELGQRLGEAMGLMGGESWLGDFPLFANVASVLRSDRESLKKAAEEIAELAPEGGIPKYADATGRAKTALTEIKGHFEAITKSMGELAMLAEETGRPDSPNIKMLRQVAIEANEAVASLRQLTGKEGDPMPADPAVALGGLKDRGPEVGSTLEALVRRVDDFARNYPMVRQHPNWRAQTRMGGLIMQIAVADVLERTSQTLAQLRLGILSMLDSGTPEQLQIALVNARQEVALLESNAAACEVLLTDLADRLSSVDEASRALLEASRGDGLLAAQVAAIDGLIKEIDDLPELKLGSVADELKEDNTVVVEANGKIRVIGFSDVFPMRQSIGGPDSSEDVKRTFNGDSAIGSGILALTQDHPFATVVLVSFEPPAPQQRSPFMPPPPRSWIPSRALSLLRKRLEAGNFVVKDWNLATPDAVQPEPDEGAENVYVVLPPAPPAAPNPFGGGPPPGPTFGEEHRAKVRELLDNDARMVFLATWEITSAGPFGGAPQTPMYGYASMLSEDWGIDVDNSRRVVWIEPDRRKANTFMVAPRRFNHMPAGRFLDHPAGSPLRGTRFLINDACPLAIRDALPEGITAEAVLRIPDRENYIGARLPEMMRIITQIQDVRAEGKVTLVPFPDHGPFDVMVTAERKRDGKGAGKIAVMGFGASVRDDFLGNPVVAPGEVLRFDPPPTENADLFVNTLYWLGGQTQWVARGPVPVPRVEAISEGTESGIRAFVYVIWPLVVFAPGVVLWWVRRR